MSKKQVLFIVLIGAVIGIAGAVIAKNNQFPIARSWWQLNWAKVVQSDNQNNDNRDGALSEDEKQVVEKDSPYSDTITLLFGGDVMLGRSVNTRQIKYGSWDWAWQEIDELTREADMTMVNLETPVIRNCASTDEGMIFCAPAESISGLSNAGVDVVNLANNHTYNQGTEGFKETQKILRAAGVLFTGVNSEDLEKNDDDGETTSFTNAKTNDKQKEISNLAIYKIKIGDENSVDQNQSLEDNNNSISKSNNQVLIGVLGYDDVSRYFDENEITEIKSEIFRASQQVDILVVTWHWGVEYQGKPEERQQSLAYESATAGADIIIGHHPHWVQTYEEYQGVPIYYSLGNLIFDQMWSEKTRRGLLVETFWQKNATSEKWQMTEKIEFPTQIYDYGQPRLISQ